MRYYLAFDIGGTKTIGAIVSDQGKIVEQLRIPTQPHLGPENLIQSLFEIVEQFIAKGYRIDAIGVGAAGRIDIHQGSVFYASDNIPGWTNQNIKQQLEEKFSIITFVDNDCNVAGLGEEWLGVAKQVSSYVSLSLGTGVGAAVKVNGKLLHGAHWSGGELGHMTLYPEGHPCNCGLKGCLEQYCSGPALVKTFNRIVQEDIKDGYEFFELVKSNHEVAVCVLNEFVKNLVTACVSLFNIYDPEVIIIGGGLIDTKEYWWDNFQEQLKASSLNDLFKLNVVQAQLGSLAAIYGAAYLAKLGLEG